MPSTTTSASTAATSAPVVPVAPAPVAVLMSPPRRALTPIPPVIAAVPVVAPPVSTVVVALTPVAALVVPIPVPVPVAAVVVAITVASVAPVTTVAVPIAAVVVPVSTVAAVAVTTVVVPMTVVAVAPVPVWGQWLRFVDFLARRVRELTIARRLVRRRSSVEGVCGVSFKPMTVELECTYRKLRPCLQSSRTRGWMLALRSRRTTAVVIPTTFWAAIMSDRHFGIIAGGTDRPVLSHHLMHRYLALQSLRRSHEVRVTKTSHANKNDDMGSPGTLESADLAVGGGPRSIGRYMVSAHTQVRRFPPCSDARSAHRAFTAGMVYLRRSPFGVVSS